MLQSEPTGADRPVLSLHNLRPELRFVSVQSDRIKVGALATLSDLVRSAGVNVRAPVLAQAARQVATAPVRNRITVGGNLLRVSADGDTLAAWMALEATVDLRGPSGVRNVPPGAALAEDELITSVQAPLPTTRARQYFGKQVGADGERRFVLAGVLELERGVIRQARLAVGTAAGTRRAAAAEEVLTGARPTASTLERVLRALDDAGGIDRDELQHHLRRLLATD